MFTASNKSLWFVIWIVCLVALCAMLIIIEYLHESMHECIGGYYDATWATEMAMLLAYILPCLLLGLVLRKPVVRLNDWFIRKLEDTKLM